MRVVGWMCPCKKRPKRAGKVFFLARSPEAPRTRKRERERIGVGVGVGVGENREKGKPRAICQYGV